MLSEPKWLYPWASAIMCQSNSSESALILEPSFKGIATLEPPAPRVHTCPMATAAAEYTAAAARPAKVPSKLTAPSVPRGTNFRLDMRYVVLPYAWTAAAGHRTLAGTVLTQYLCSPALHKWLARRLESGMSSATTRHSRKAVVPDVKLQLHSILCCLLKQQRQGDKSHAHLANLT